MRGLYAQPMQEPARVELHAFLEQALLSNIGGTQLRTFAQTFSTTPVDALASWLLDYGLTESLLKTSNATILVFARWAWRHRCWMTLANLCTTFRCVDSILDAEALHFDLWWALQTIDAVAWPSSYRQALDHATACHAFQNHVQTQYPLRVHSDMPSQLESIRPGMLNACCWYHDEFYLYCLVRYWRTLQDLDSNQYLRASQWRGVSESLAHRLSTMDTWLAKIDAFLSQPKNTQKSLDTIVLRPSDWCWWYWTAKMLQYGHIDAWRSYWYQRMPWCWAVTEHALALESQALDLRDVFRLWQRYTSTTRKTLPHQIVLPTGI